MKATKTRRQRPTKEKQAVEQPATPALKDFLITILRNTIELQRLETGKGDSEPFAAEEMANAAATVGAIMTLACPMSGRALIFCEMAQLAERLLPR